MYLLSPTELWEQYSYDILNYNLNASKTRQLDYYDDRMGKIIVCNPNFPDELCYDATVKFPASDDIPWETSTYYWGLRGAYTYSNWDSSFYRVISKGIIGEGVIIFTESYHLHGVSPAFRIAEKTN